MIAETASAKADGACFVETVWAEDTAPLYKYLQCVHGSQHHSFVFFGGKFIGDGFALEQQRMGQSEFEAAVNGAGASLQCQREGDKSLLAAPLQSCTQSNDGSTTGWARTGSCNWDPNDSGCAPRAPRPRRQHGHGRPASPPRVRRRPCC